MLVLKRSVNEDIVIDSADGPITIRVVRARNGSLRIGVDAPRETPVHRREVFEEIHEGSPELLAKLPTVAA